MSAVTRRYRSMAVLVAFVLLSAAPCWAAGYGIEQKKGSSQLVVTLDAGSRPRSIRS